MHERLCCVGPEPCSGLGLRLDSFLELRKTAYIRGLQKHHFLLGPANKATRYR